AILGRLPCKLTWIDPRPDVFPTQVPANTRVVIEEEPAWMVDEAPANACYVVMTHSHALDLEIVERALRRTDACFGGLIGSETKAASITFSPSASATAGPAVSLRGAMSHAVATMAKAPAIHTQAGAWPLWRMTNQTRISAPASVMPTSTSHAQRLPKVIA